MQHTIDPPRDTSGGGPAAGAADRGRHRRAPVMLATFDSAAFDPHGTKLALSDR
jgi:hypothetical protein